MTSRSSSQCAGTLSPKPFLPPKFPNIDIHNTFTSSYGYPVDALNSLIHHGFANKVHWIDENSLYLWCALSSSVFTVSLVCPLQLCVHCISGVPSPALCSLYLWCALSSSVFTVSLVCPLQLCVHCISGVPSPALCSLYLWCALSSSVFTVSLVCPLQLCVHCISGVPSPALCSLYLWCALSSSVFTVSLVCPLQLCVHLNDIQQLRTGLKDIPNYLDWETQRQSISSTKTEGAVSRVYETIATLLYSTDEDMDHEMLKVYTDISMALRESVVAVIRNVVSPKLILEKVSVFQLCCVYSLMIPVLSCQELYSLCTNIMFFSHSLSLCMCVCVCCVCVCVCACACVCVLRMSLSLSHLLVCVCVCVCAGLHVSVFVHVQLCVQWYVTM